jgi:hypothetical protein
MEIENSKNLVFLKKKSPMKNNIIPSMKRSTLFLTSNTYDILDSHTKKAI